MMGMIINKNNRRSTRKLIKRRFNRRIRRRLASSCHLSFRKLMVRKVLLGTTRKTLSIHILKRMRVAVMKKNNNSDRVWKLRKRCLDKRKLLIRSNKRCFKRCKLRLKHLTDAGWWLKKSSKLVKMHLIFYLEQLPVILTMEVIITTDQRLWLHLPVDWQVR